MKVISSVAPSQVSVHDLLPGTAFSPQWDKLQIYIKVAPGSNMNGMPGSTYALNVGTSTIIRYADAGDPSPVTPRSEVTIQTNEVK